MKKGNTYLVKCTRTGIYKIGHSITPLKRLVGIKTGNPFVELIGTTSTPEIKLHRKYADYRIGGEWFEFPEEVEENVINEFFEWITEPKNTSKYKTKQNQTADLIGFEYAKDKAELLLNNDEDNVPKQRLGLFILIGIYTGIKAKQLFKLKYEDIRGLEYMNYHRSNKTEEQMIPIPSIIQYYLQTKFKNNTGLIFVTQKSKGGEVISIQTINRSLKEAFVGIVDKKNISTHTLRKVYGRKIYDINNKSISALNKLQSLFNQSSIKTTREYLQIVDEDEDINLIIEE